MKLFIKNMVCPRCIKVVKDELQNLGFEISDIQLGEVDLNNELTSEEISAIKQILLQNGFELIEDKSVKLIEEIKKTIISLIQSGKENKGTNLSSLLENKLDKDYNYLSTLFSSKENITIEHFYILQKVEKAKELLKYDELTLSEISYRLGYNSVNHLSSQFKKITGMTATEFKKSKAILRKPIDKLT